MADPAPTRRERRKLFRALRKLRKSTELVNALNAKAQLQAQRKGPPGRQDTYAVDAEGKEVAL